MIKLIIVDSVMALYRVDYQGRGELATRQQALGQFLHKLHQLTQQFNVAAVLTNQVGHVARSGECSRPPAATWLLWTSGRCSCPSYRVPPPVAADDIRPGWRNDVRGRPQEAHRRTRSRPRRPDPRRATQRIGRDPDRQACGLAEPPAWRCHVRDFEWWHYRRFVTALRRRGPACKGCPAHQSSKVAIAGD